MQMLTIGKALLTAEETYFLANGTYTTSLDQLDISIPTEANAHSTNNDITVFPKLNFSIWFYDSYAVFMGPHNTRLTVYYKFQPEEKQSRAGKLICYGWDMRSIRVCKALGKLETETFDSAHLDRNYYTLN